MQLTILEYLNTLDSVCYLMFMNTYLFILSRLRYFRQILYSVPLSLEIRYILLLLLTPLYFAIRKKSAFSFFFLDFPNYSQYHIVAAEQKKSFKILLNSFFFGKLRVEEILKLKIYSQKIVL